MIHSPRLSCGNSVHLTRRNASICRYAVDTLPSRSRIDGCIEWGDTRLPDQDQRQPLGDRSADAEPPVAALSCWSSPSLSSCPLAAFHDPVGPEAVDPTAAPT